jgi:hypothetical protein
MLQDGEENTQALDAKSHRVESIMKKLYGHIRHGYAKCARSNGGKLLIASIRPVLGTPLSYL